MGITGLLPYLEKKKSSRPCSLKEFSGGTVAADAYCWLHKGAFACADKLARGEPTDMYVQYCMKYVNMLLYHNIKPILVFDGRHLPAKSLTEKKRREKREENRSQAAALLRQGRASEARTFLQRCVDVTHAMALTVMKECRKVNVDCIVAPHEADAQLAFFSLEGIADLVITEDSDLLLFGCKKVMFKLDFAGNGVLVEEEKLKLCMGVRPQNFSFDKFRYMCILSGCDYLESLPGIGLVKACQFITRTQDPDIHRALSRLPFQLNIKGLNVSKEYRDSFIKADAMFRHQLVFDPRTRKVKPLTPYTPVDPTSPLAGGPLPGCKPELEDSLAYQLALGNLDPKTLEQMDTFDPDAPKQEDEKMPYYGVPAKKSSQSIWSKEFYNQEQKKPTVKPSFQEVSSRTVTKGKIESLNVDVFNKRKREEDENSGRDLQKDKRQALDESKILSMYSTPSPTETRPTSEKMSPTKIPNSDPTSPILTPKRIGTNPFIQRNNTNKTNNGKKLFSLLDSPSLGVPNVKSRYFGNSAKAEPTTNPSKVLASSNKDNTLISPEGVVGKSEESSVDSSQKLWSPSKQTPENMLEESAKSSEISNNPMVTVINENASGSAEISVVEKDKDEFVSPVKRAVWKSPQETHKKDTKAGKKKTLPQLGGGVSKQGLLSGFGFVPKAKLQKS